MLLQLSTAAGAATSEQGVAFDIRESKLSDALLSFARQADLSIVFSADAELDVQLESQFKGRYQPAALLRQLLEGTQLRAEFLYDDVVAISPKPCAKNQRCKQALEWDADLSELARNPRLEQMLVLGKKLTGSRLQLTEFGSSAPVDIISAFDIELAGEQSVGELLQNLPSVFGNSTSTAISNGGDGTATVTLRGLPANNTLVLINGRRIANDGLAGESFDLNSLSPASIERIEVLKSGSSAIYGSDAIAGVINIILKRKADGFKVSAYHGQSSRGDLATQTYDLSFGHEFDRGTFFLSATRFTQDPIFSRDRQRSASADGRQLGGVDNRSSATPNTRITLDNDNVVTLASDGADNLLPGTQTEHFRPATAEDLFNFQSFSTAVVPSERESLFTTFSLDVTDRIGAVFEYAQTEHYAKSQFAPTPVFTAFETAPISISANNIFNPFQTEITDARRRLLELGERTGINKSRSKRVALGLEGGSADIEWNVLWHWSKTQATETLTNLVDLEQLANTLGGPDQCAGITFDGCQPVNFFGPVGSISGPALEQLRAIGQTQGFFKLGGFMLNAAFTPIEISSGEVEAAFGMEYRAESTGIAPEDPDLITIGGANFTSSSGKRNVSELYTEFRIPLWSNKKDKTGLDFELAARYSKYSDFGEEVNPRVALQYKPIKTLTVRTSYASGFRAPSLIELNKTSSETQAFVIDPCSIPENVGVLQGCRSLTDATRLQFLTKTGGNPDLLAEESDHVGLGLSWRPMALSGLLASIDYFRISQRNVVDANAQFILDQNAANGAFADRVVRDVNGEITEIIATNINIGRRVIDGLDFSLKYALPRSEQLGRLHLSIDGTHLLGYREQLNPELPTRQLAGTFVDDASEGRGAIPKWKVNMGAYWKLKQWQANYSVRYTSGFTETLPMLNRERRINSWLVHDLQVGYLFLVGDGLRLTMGIDNLFDKDAPFAATAFNDNIDARTHDLTGRYWYGKLSFNF